MEERFHSLTEKVFKKDPALVTPEETQELARQYPYFAPVHFIRLLQFPESSESYQQQLQKSILYYPDPLSFEQFVHAQDLAEWNEERVTGVEDTELDQAAELPSETSVSQEATQFEVVVPEDEDPVVHHLEPEPELEAPMKVVEISDGLPQSPDFETIEDIAAVEAEAIPSEAIAAQEQPIPMPLPAPAENVPTELTFEPYHTVDYFASQGIKITAESVSGDKFGKQVKSFTDWLKTMKRLPLAELGKNVSPVIEQKVENMAEHSVADADVVTESMAQVWKKQGNVAKAVEVYRKLSLQNPSKRAYFAAEIDKLTGNH